MICIVARSGLLRSAVGSILSLFYFFFHVENDAKKQPGQNLVIIVFLAELSNQMSVLKSV